MALTPEPQAHDWKITTPSAGTSASFGGMVVAICRSCGLIRTGQLPNIGREGRIDLSGTCALSEGA
jgi:hypothetical protein